VLCKKGGIKKTKHTGERVRELRGLIEFPPVGKYAWATVKEGLGGKKKRGREGSRDAGGGADGKAFAKTILSRLRRENVRASTRGTLEEGKGEPYQKRSMSVSLIVKRGEKNPRFQHHWGQKGNQKRGKVQFVAENLVILWEEVVKRGTRGRSLCISLGM